MSLHDDPEIDQMIAMLKLEFPIFDDVSFNEFNIGDKLKTHAFVLMRYQDELSKERGALERLNELFETLIGKRYHHYKFERDEELQKAEIEKYYLPADPEIRKFKKILRKQQARVKYFEVCVDGLQKMGWNMKHFIDSNRVSF
jgi:hypothetical protein